VSSSQSKTSYQQELLTLKKLSFLQEILRARLSATGHGQIDAQSLSIA